MFPIYKKPRSYLVVPSVKLDRFGPKLFELLDPASAAENRPHALIIDIEDSVPPPLKATGRSCALEFFRSSQYQKHQGDCLWMLKINECHTEYADDDLQLLRELSPRGVGVALAKVEHTDDVARILGETGIPAARCFPAIETLRGFVNRDALCASWAQLGVPHMAFGAGDMSLELEVERNYEVESLRTIFLQLIISAKLHNIRLIDSPCRAIPSKAQSSAELVTAECQFSHRNGSAGKIAIHPSQLPFINQIYSPRNQQQAAMVVNLFENNLRSRAQVDPSTHAYVGTPSYKQALRALEDETE